jgi:hypothetical protein
MAVATVDLREVDVILHNPSARVPVRVSFHQQVVEVRVMIYGEDGERIAVHDIEVGLVEEKVRLLVRSPLGTLPITSLLHDFACVSPEDNEG